MISAHAKVDRNIKNAAVINFERRYVLNFRQFIALQA